MVQCAVFGIAGIPTPRPVERSPPMHRIVVVFGVLLMLLGLGGYLVLAAIGANIDVADADARSLTALIPAVAGLTILICGLVAAKPGARKHAMHVAMIFALLGIIAPWVGIGPSFSEGFDSGILLNYRYASIGMGITTSGLCLLLLVLGIRSFIAAGRASRGR